MLGRSGSNSEFDAFGFPGLCILDAPAPLAFFLSSPFAEQKETQLTVFITLIIETSFSRQCLCLCVRASLLKSAYDLSLLKIFKAKLVIHISCTNKIASFTDVCLHLMVRLHPFDAFEFQSLGRQEENSENLPFISNLLLYNFLS
uniref:Uncharacterized protein n=1 Tax=Rhizophora mucronata TaxID=61149 RepID=A0A2P2N4T8_RHIMU